MYHNLSLKIELRKQIKIKQNKNKKKECTELKKKEVKNHFKKLK